MEGNQAIINLDSGKRAKKELTWKYISISKFRFIPDPFPVHLKFLGI